MSIVQNDLHQFTITALQYEESKYDAIDSGAFIEKRPISIINPTVQDPVKNVVLSADSFVNQGLSIAVMRITWDQVQGATKYQIEWRKDDGSWIKMPISGSNSVEVQGIYAGQYQARVTAINAFDSTSLPTYSMLTALTGKQGLPPELAFIRATGVLFGMQIDWGFPSVGASDTAYTEIQVSPDGVSNIAQLGLFAYPTSTHTAQGLQGNLTQKYRGRLVDRIGDIGAWSEWASGTTIADANLVLELLDGQITESQLDQALREKIDANDGIEEVLDKVNKQWYVKADSGGAVSGIAFGIEPTGESQFLVRANRFAIAPPAGVVGNSKYAFVYQSTAEILPNGTVIPSGLYLDQATIGRIDASKIYATELSAISANLGTLTSIASDGSKTILTGALTRVFYANGVMAVRMGVW